MKGGEITKIWMDELGGSLIIEINSWTDGSLVINLPRDLIDSKKRDGSDDAFFILVDGEEMKFDESKTPTERIVTIPFDGGAEFIEIIKTFVN